MKLPQMFKSAIGHPHRWLLWGIAAALASGLSGVGSPQSAYAAEKMVLTYGLFGRSITIDELEEFAATGRQPPTLKFLLKAAKQDPEQVRQLLQREVTH